MQKSLQFIKAASILGLKPTGVEKAPDCLLKAGLRNMVSDSNPLIEIPVQNYLYSTERDVSGMINAQALRSFSEGLFHPIAYSIKNGQFPIVLGGDCSILLGIMAALKSCGEYGLVTLDAHADFYGSMESVSGEAADMDIALITGRGPDLLTNINGLKPYVEDRNVIHIGQRDEEETLQYGSQQIQETRIHQFSMKEIEQSGIDNAISTVSDLIISAPTKGHWIHLDTDVLCDNENPAVDYRLPGGLTFSECAMLLNAIISLQKTMGISIAIYNPSLDKENRVADRLVKLFQDILAK